MYIVDRIEEDYVVLEQEDKTMQEAERSKFPEGIKAGDVVYENGDCYLIDEEATEKRSKEIKKLMDDLWEE